MSSMDRASADYFEAIEAWADGELASLRANPEAAIDYSNEPPQRPNVHMHMHIRLRMCMHMRLCGPLIVRAHALHCSGLKVRPWGRLRGPQTRVDSRVRRRSEGC